MTVNNPQECYNRLKIGKLQQRHIQIFLAANDIQVSGIEFICNAEGEIFSYDINTNTNYISDAEEKAGKYGHARTCEGFEICIGKKMKLSCWRAFY